MMILFILQLVRSKLVSSIQKKAAYVKDLEDQVTYNFSSLIFMRTIKNWLNKIPKHLLNPKVEFSMMMILIFLTI